MAMKTKEFSNLGLIMDQLGEQKDDLFSDLHDENFPDKNAVADATDVHLLEELSKRASRYTTDFHELKFQKHIPIFVYGTLRAGQRLHDVLKDCPCLGEGMTVGTEYEMFTYTAGGFPVVLNQKDKDKEFSSIYGEIYVVSPEHVLELDQIESNNFMYKREIRAVWALDQTVKEGSRLRPAVRCWMYIGVSDHWENVVNMRRVHPVNVPSDVILGKIKKTTDWLAA